MLLGHFAHGTQKRRVKPCNNMVLYLTLWSVLKLGELRADIINVTVAVMEDNESSTLRFGWNRTMPAVNMAEEVVTRMYGGQIQFTFTYHETTCRSNGASAIFADIRCRYGLSVLIGPGCSVPMYSIAPLAMAWNIPVVNPIASGLYDKTKYPLVTALSPFSPTSFAGAIKAFFKRFGYTNIIIIEDILPNYATPKILKETLIASLRSSSEKYNYRVFHADSGDVNMADIKRALDQAKNYGRVFLLFARSALTRAFMLEAKRRGMAMSGEYVFIIIYKLSWGPYIPWVDRHASDEENVAYLESLGQAYFPYMEVWPELRRGNNFTEELIRRSREDFGFDYGNELPTQWIPGYYDAVMMYAQVLNETIAAGGDPSDGLTITRNLVNRTFPGILREVKVNEEGIRLNDVTFGYYELGTAAWKRAAIWQYQSNDLQEISPGFVWRYNYDVPPPNEPKCGYSGEKCQPKDDKQEVLALAVGLVAGLLVASALAGLLVHRAWKKQMRTDLWWWKIEPSDLTFTNTEFYSTLGSTMKGSMRNLGGQDGMSHTSDTNFEDSAIWKGQRVRINKMSIINNHSPSQELLLEFALIRELNHTNISKVLGACLTSTLNALVTERCSKGSLQDLLGNGNVTLDDQFKFSLCTDVINGLCYLHDTPVRCHGRLSSQACLIDNRFTVKLADYGLATLYSSLIEDKSSQEYKKECLWKAPELLREDTAKQCGGCREIDIYSCAIVMDEIFTREAPYFAESDLLTVDEILDKVAAGLSPPFRPSMKIWSDEMKVLIEQCWTEEPKQRPTAAAVRSSLRRITSSQGTSTNILDNLMRRMEMYANNLEKMVEDKTIELREEKKRSEELLYQILPRSVANKLRMGRRVEPQSYESVTIFFSDIVGFTSLSAESSPFEIVALLNDLYTCFDAIIDEYDVYKVETIGDAYMVVSGLPQENGNLHAVHISNMSLKLLEGITQFKVRHRPGMRIMLRIGCHSGSVVAGVVGLKMPRYCLFGDTVNTASRMESNGEALKIHLSQSVKHILDSFNMFTLESRGAIPIKGKGFMETYWLTGRIEESMGIQPVDDSEDEIREDG